MILPLTELSNSSFLSDRLLHTWGVEFFSDLLPEVHETWLLRCVSRQRPMPTWSTAAYRLSTTSFNSSAIIHDLRGMDQGWHTLALKKKKISFKTANSASIKTGIFRTKLAPSTPAKFRPYYYEFCNFSSIIPAISCRKVWINLFLCWSNRENSHLPIT